MLFCQREEGRLIFEVGRRHRVVRMLLMPSLLMIGNKTPTEEADRNFLLGFRQIIHLDPVDKGLILGAALDNDPVLILWLCDMCGCLQLQLVLIY